MKFEVVSSDEGVNIDGDKGGKAEPSSNAENEEEEEEEEEEDKLKDEPLPFMQAVFPMILSAGMDYFGLGMMIPLLPFIVKDLGGGSADVGYVLFAQYLGVTVGSLTMGRIADVISRKFAIQLACTGDIVFFLLTGFAPTIELLIACRVLAGIFTPLVPSISWVIDAGKGNGHIIAKNMGIWSFTMSMTIMGGSVVGGLLGENNWILANSLCAALAFVALVVVSMTPPPPRMNASEKPQGLEIVTKQPEYISLMLMNVGLGVSMTGSIIAASIILAYQLESTAIQIAMFFVGVAVLHSFLNITLLPNSIKWFSSTIPAMSLVLALSVMASIILCFDFAYSSLVVVCILMTLTTAKVPTGMTAANILSGQYADKYTKSAKSQVLGISRLAFNVGQVLGPLLATMSINFGGNVAYFGITMALDLGTILTWMCFHSLASWRDEREEQAEQGDDGGVEMVMNIKESV